MLDWFYPNNSPPKQSAIVPGQPDFSAIEISQSLDPFLKIVSIKPVHVVEFILFTLLTFHYLICFITFHFPWNVRCFHIRRPLNSRVQGLSLRELESNAQGGGGARTLWPWAGVGPSRAGPTVDIWVWLSCLILSCCQQCHDTCQLD